MRGQDIRHGTHVLIVDDDPDIQRLVSYNLDQAGFQVAAAATGRTALEAVEEQPPDLIILDIMLPDVDGMEVCRILRQREKLAAHSHPHADRARRRDRSCGGFRTPGADDYVMAKPFSRS